MNRHFTKALAIAGLATVVTSTAHAHDRNVEFDVRIGQSWLQYNVNDSRYNRDYDHRAKHKRKLWSWMHG